MNDDSVGGGQADVSANSAISFLEPLPAPNPDSVRYEQHLRNKAAEIARLAVRAQCAEERYRVLFENASDAITILNPDGVILEANERWRSLIGVPPEEMVGRHIREFAPPGQGATNSDHYHRAVQRGGDRVRATAILHRDGRTIYMEFSTTVIEVDGQPTVFSIGHDVTEQIEATRSIAAAEEKYRRAQRMEAIGRLAGGVAHDFNNMLNVILGYSQMLIDSLTEGEPMYDALAEVRRAAERSADLTQQLLAFSQQQPMQAKTVNVNDSVERTLRLIARVLGEDVNVHTVLVSDPCCVQLGQGQLEQILMNLVVNARDAMPSGGELTLETRVVAVSDEEAAQHALAMSGPYVMLSVRDNGTGMDAATLDRIFEPFFTTKEQGKGTGLGLATVFGIVRQAGGYIAVESLVGEGSTFRVVLPRVDLDADCADGHPPVSRPTEGGGTVLLVEDEDQLRTLIRRGLHRGGYRVLVADSPEDALRISKTHEGDIDLLLTDVIMPKMNGRQLADRLVVERPRMKVLFMSGYTQDVALNLGASGTSFLEKPLSLDVLRKKIGGMLGARVSP
ncbi:MAG TPA: ATP-binding protein [Polyangiaceae bacterium]|nr:ATP-binding protein [Polyangiaceae bacterium]